MTYVAAVVAREVVASCCRTVVVECGSLVVVGIEY